MYYSRKKSNTDYIVLKHPLRDFTNTYFQGLKFCRGYGVVAKNSKVHRSLKKIPMFKQAKEFDLAYLKNVFRTKEVEVVFGKDIYLHYLDSIGLGTKSAKSSLTEKLTALKEEADRKRQDAVSLAETTSEEAPLSMESEEVEETDPIQNLSADEKISLFKTIGKCSYVKKDGDICGNKSIKGSPSGFCFGHLRLDPLRKSRS